MNSANPSVTKIFFAFARIGLVSLGGGLVAYLRDELVTAKKWMTADEFLAALEIGQTMPGLNSVNIAVIAGRKLAGPLGAAAAATGVIVPGAAILCLLGFLYVRYHKNPDVTALLAGIAAAAVGLLLQVTLKIGKKQLIRPIDIALVAVTFFLTGIIHLSLLATLVIVAPIALFIYRPKTLPNPSEHEGNHHTH